MNIAKGASIIIGIILIIFSTITFFGMATEAQGAELGGALTGYIIIIALSLGLLYFGSREQSNSNKKPSYAREINPFVRANKDIDRKKPLHDNIQETHMEAKPSEEFSFQKQIESLKNLQEKGLVSETELQEKLEKLKDKEFKRTFEDSKEFQQIETLYNSGVFTEEEFELKKKILLEIGKANLIIPRNIEEEILSRIKAIDLVGNGFDLQFGRFETYSVILLENQKVKMWRKISDDSYFTYGKRGELVKFENKFLCLETILEVSEN